MAMFEEVKFPANKRVRCAACSKPITRATTFSQTINPYNKRADGQMKSREDIWTELRAQAGTWKLRPETCAKCRYRRGGVTWPTLRDRYGR